MNSLPTFHRHGHSSIGFALLAAAVLLMFLGVGVGWTRPRQQSPGQSGQSGSLEGQLAFQATQYQAAVSSGDWAAQAALESQIKGTLQLMADTGSPALIGTLQSAAIELGSAGQVYLPAYYLEAILRLPEGRNAVVGLLSASTATTSLRVAATRALSGIPGPDADEQVRTLWSAHPEAADSMAFTEYSCVRGLQMQLDSLTSPMDRVLLAVKALDEADRWTRRESPLDPRELGNLGRARWATGILGSYDSAFVGACLVEYRPDFSQQFVDPQSSRSVQMIRCETYELQERLARYHLDATGRAAWEAFAGPPPEWPKLPGEE